jgi:hypothetical protein
MSRLTQVDATERSTLTEVPDIKVGDTYDENEIGRKMQAWETRMRERGLLRGSCQPERQHLRGRLGVSVPEPRARSHGAAGLRG